MPCFNEAEAAEEEKDVVVRFERGGSSVNLARWGFTDMAICDPPFTNRLPQNYNLRPRTLYYMVLKFYGKWNSPGFSRRFRFRKSDNSVARIDGKSNHYD
jgi:hypothetical protein